MSDVIETLAEAIRSCDQAATKFGVPVDARRAAKKVLKALHLTPESAQALAEGRAAVVVAGAPITLGGLEALITSAASQTKESDS